MWITKKTKQYNYTSLSLPRYLTSLLSLKVNSSRRQVIINGRDAREHVTNSIYFNNKITSKIMEAIKVQRHETTDRPSSAAEPVQHITWTEGHD